MEKIRQAEKQDISRIAELMVVNYRVNFYRIFKNDDYYFKELNVLDTAAEYQNDPRTLANTYVYDDGVVKGFIRVKGNEIEKLFVEPEFQSCGIGAKLLGYAAEKLGAEWLWVLEYNERGMAFYRRNGFELTGKKMFEDGWIPLLEMALDKEKGQKNG
ncbi:MAG: GNAT family N-acetyltransferase [Ruminococcus sp.]|nr:GNAT family N-acetyltransferase [Ruminococcus sp.]MBR4622826.1 GNAT family N-acetyltransferase [Ruminococcus sp.]